MIFQVMRVELNYRKGQKQVKKIALHLEYLATPPIYKRAYPEKLPTASPGNPVSIAKSSLLRLFVQSDKKFSEESTKVKETLFLTKFGNKYLRKNRSQSEFASKLIAIHTA